MWQNTLVHIDTSCSANIVIVVIVLYYVGFPYRCIGLVTELEFYFGDRNFYEYVFYFSFNLPAKPTSILDTDCCIRFSKYTISDG
jgi:hypothetical protein